MIQLGMYLPLQYVICFCILILIKILINKKYIPCAIFSSFVCIAVEVAAAKRLLTLALRVRREYVAAVGKYGQHEATGLLVRPHVRRAGT